MKAYCVDCFNPYPLEELKDCICVIYSYENGVRNLPTFRFPTKNGIKEIHQDYLYCKDCLDLKHRHEGEEFI